MQREISNRVQLVENLNPLKDISKVPSIDNTTDLKDVFGKVDKLTTLWGKGKADINLIRYIPGLTQVSRQCQINNMVAKKVYASLNYTDKKHLNLQSN